MLWWHSDFITLKSKWSLISLHLHARPVRPWTSMYLNSLMVERNLLSLNHICPSLIIYSMIISHCLVQRQVQRKTPTLDKPRAQQRLEIRRRRGPCRQNIGMGSFDKQHRHPVNLLPKQKPSDLSALESNEFIWILLSECYIDPRHSPSRSAQIR